MSFFYRQPRRQPQGEYPRTTMLIRTEGQRLTELLFSNYLFVFIEGKGLVDGFP